VCLLLQHQQFEGGEDDRQVSVSPEASCSFFTTRAFNRRLTNVFRLARNINMKAHSCVFQGSVASSATEGHLGATSYTGGVTMNRYKTQGVWNRH